MHGYTCLRPSCKYRVSEQSIRRSESTEAPDMYVNLDPQAMGPGNKYSWNICLLTTLQAVSVFDQAFMQIAWACIHITNVLIVKIWSWEFLEAVKVWAD